MSGVALSAPTSKSGRLQRQVLDLLHEHRDAGELPTNGRFVFYELEQAGVVSKVPTGKRRPDQDVSDALMRLREIGLVPWDWIDDETRALYGFDYAATVAEEIAGAVANARISPWDGRPSPLVIVESRSLGGVLRPLIVDRYLCRLAATNGQVGGFLRTELAPILQDNEREVLYLGDHDLCGDQIEANTRRVLVHGAARDIEWRRIAITQRQIDERDLQPIVKNDRRYRPPREHEAWETEALGQTTVVALVREALDDLLPEPLNDVLVRERVQRVAAVEFFATWGES